MLRFTTILFLFFFFGANSQDVFNTYFTDASMRIDFNLAGNTTSENFYLEQIKKEPYWGGTKNNLIDPFNYGKYRFEVIDSASNKVIYTNGFSTLFSEWQTTAEAHQLDKSFYQTFIFPYPQSTILLKVYSRVKGGKLATIFKHYINPDNYFINPQLSLEFPTKKVVDNGDPDKCVDLVFVAEGYTNKEMDKFLKDVERISSFLFTQIPFNQYKEKFNVWAVMSESKESGTDIPGERVYRNTVMNSNFYTFDLSRYITSTDIKTIRDIAANVPYDHICVLVNDSTYGGGGIYNYYSLSTVDHEISNIVFVHEFGHGFAGLGDEYYNSEVAYEGFYELDVEPWEPNLTTMVNFDVKWKDMIDKNTPVPTPREDKYKSTIGVFEGGGYETKGVYSPFMDCRIRTNEAPSFCPVCQKSIIKMIKYYSE